jgi:hypothetical protein
VSWYPSDNTFTDGDLSQVFASLNPDVPDITKPVVVSSAAFLGRFATFVFQLTLTNFLGGVGTASVSVERSSENGFPGSQIAGNSNLEIAPGDILQVDGIASPSRCYPNASVAFEWKLYEGDTNLGTVLNISSTSQNPRRFRLSAYTLQPLQAYLLCFVVRQTVFSSEACASIYVTAGTISAIVDGK